MEDKISNIKHKQELAVVKLCKILSWYSKKLYIQKNVSNVSGRPSQVNPIFHASAAAAPGPGSQVVAKVGIKMVIITFCPTACTAGKLGRGLGG